MCIRDSLHIRRHHAIVYLIRCDLGWHRNRPLGVRQQRLIFQRVRRRSWQFYSRFTGPRMLVPLFPMDCNRRTRGNHILYELTDRTRDFWVRPTGTESRGYCRWDLCWLRLRTRAGLNRPHTVRDGLVRTDVGDAQAPSFPADRLTTASKSNHPPSSRRGVQHRKVFGQILNLGGRKT